MNKNNFFQPGHRPALAMLLCSCIAFAVTASYEPANADAAVNATVSGTEITANKTVPLKEASNPSAEAEESTEKTVAAPEKEYQPTPYLLNLAYQFPEGSEDNYAEILMQELIQKDSQWYAEIYDMANTAPAKLAKRLGRSAGSLMGKYNPTSKTQKKDDPSTWTVEHFKNVKVSFYDGDGNVTSAVSNAQDILSMASVYSYYHDPQDIKAIRSYMNQLWSISHSYGVSMGDVYYCDGCVDPSEGISEDSGDSELENEDTFVEDRNINTEINTAPAASEGAEGEGGHTDGSSTGNESAAEAGISVTDPNSSSANSSTAGPANDTAAGPGNGSTAGPAAAAPSDTSAPSKITASDEENSAADSAQAGEETTTGPLIIEETKHHPLIITEPETESRETTEFVWDPETAPPPLIIRLEEETSEEKSEDPTETAAADTQLEEESGSAEETAVAVPTPSEATETTTAKAKETAAEKPKKKPAAASNNKICPGHVDLKITAKIRSLNEASNLYELDKKGNTVDETLPWTGWTSRNKAFVRHIDRQSWTEEYGLNVTLPGTRAPLSSTEVESYMNQLPSNTTEARKSIVRFALQSVGKVPYYWGGKPSAKNYSGNSFGSVTIPDHKGRILRGLDCSGWINWVYWTVTGSRLPYEGTDGLRMLGQQVNRQDLKPGDIIVITGSTPHVIMFLNWTADGQIQCVHETGSANNVTVGTLTANWPYYRNLLGE